MCVSVCVCFERIVKNVNSGGEGTEYANNKQLPIEYTDDFSICLELLIKMLLKVDNRM